MLLNGEQDNLNNSTQNEMNFAESNLAPWFRRKKSLACVVGMKYLGKLVVFTYFLVGLHVK